MLNPTDFTDLWKPSYPFATNNFENGMRRMPRDKAITKLHIETAPKYYRNLMVIDLDRYDSEYHMLSLIHDSGVVPPPSFTTISRASNNSHVGYFIGGSIQTTRALEYFNDISEGLRSLIGGDPCYGGRTMRNPLHDYQRTVWGTDHLYSLNELKEFTSKAKILEVPVDKTTEQGVGRNEALFEALRKWSYRARLRFNTYEEWHIAATERANELNFSFDTPLPSQEVKTIVNSTVKWVWKNFSKETFSKIQKARSNRREVVKNAPARDKAILDMVEAKFSVNEIADNLGVGYNAAKTAIYTAKKRASQNS